MHPLITYLLCTAFQLASEALPVLMFVLVIIHLTFVSMIYIVDPREEVETLPLALWLTVVTIGTKGYGDVVPVTQGVRIILSVRIIISMLCVAIAIGMTGTLFSKVWEDQSRLFVAQRTRRRFPIFEPQSARRTHIVHRF